RRPTELHENPCAIDVAQALRPAASRLFGTLLAASRAGAREGVFEAAASPLMGTLVGRYPLRHRQRLPSRCHRL
ncbi:MAG TPA: hypothetical protein VMH81_26325, partial [Bryobacteraceae bacterium]|nr:hypothetical protein [Bryobacteraceae bacterium]